MKMTFDLPSDLVRELKLRAAREGKRFDEIVLDVVRRGWAAEPARSTSKRVRPPMIGLGQPLPPTEGLSPEGIAELISEQEVRWAREAGKF